MVNNSANAGDAGSIPGSGSSPGEGNGSPLQYSCLENSHGQRSLAGYSPWGRRELDTTEVTEHSTDRLSTDRHYAAKSSKTATKAQVWTSIAETLVNIIGPSLAS